MQIHNFYNDLMPSVRNPLDSIVLSPHTIKPNDSCLSNGEEDVCDYQTLLPSVSRCKYYEHDTCRLTQSFSERVRNRFNRFIKKRGVSGQT